MSRAWAEEPYVKLFTRDTVAWVSLPWQARAVLPELMRKLDRRGTVEIGDEGIEGLAALLRMPPDVVEPGIAELLRRRTLTLQGTRMCMPKFVEAQEARRAATPAERQQQRRERLKVAESFAKPSQKSRDVTRVTKRHDLLSDPDPSLTDPVLGGPGGDTRENPVSNGARTPRAPHRGSAIAPDWKPTKVLLARVTRELDVLTSGADFDECVRDFVDWHLHATGRAALSRDWAAKFLTWLRRDLRSGKIAKRYRTASEARVTPVTEPSAVDSSPEERKAIADRAREAVGLTGSDP